MENWQAALVVFGAVTLGMIGQGWASLLEHQKRRQMLDLIKTYVQAGKDPPGALFAQLEDGARKKAPWNEAILFAALAFGFWLAFAQAEDAKRAAYLVIAVTMTATSAACLGLALLRRGGDAKIRDDDAG
ncbi:MAG: hypothetical protein JNJ73_04385 [Hyphomonadaceae bacterium]|nr:hypothetical protein [Hyphomonadaceae bacterium]